MKAVERITLEHAQQLLVRYSTPVGCESMEVLACSGRILAEKLRASISHPPFARAAMDGYALKSKDVEEASRQNPVVLNVSGKIHAGDVSGIQLCSGNAVRIMTGGRIPEGADSVIRQEDTDCGEDVVKIYAKTQSGQCCSPKGEDFFEGDVLAVEGDRIDAYTIAAAVAAGREKLLVKKAVKVAIITTGDELKLPGSELESGQIYNSNLAYLHVRLMEMGCEIIGPYSVKDDQDAICAAVQRAAKAADVIITTGGVSVGQKDLLPDVMNALDSKIIFHGIDMKPGMPTMLSLLDKKPVLSLSGNPYSAFAVFELFMPVLIGVMQNTKKRGLTERIAVAGNTFLKKSHCRRIIRGTYDGQHVYFSEKQRNAQLTGGIGTNCLVDILPGTGEIQVGDKLRIYLLDD